MIFPQVGKNLIVDSGPADSREIAHFVPREIWLDHGQSAVISGGLDINIINCSNGGILYSR
jgi:hypothetical protein